jgi:hypothetical protein
LDLGSGMPLVVRDSRFLGLTFSVLGSYVLSS